MIAQTVNGVLKSYDYDDIGQLVDDNGTPFSYDANGNRTNTGYMTGDNNQIDTDGVWTYTYDDAGQMVAKSKSGESWTYEYDHRGQLVIAEQRDGSNDLVLQVEYRYDAFGNRIARTVFDDGLNVVEAERYLVDGWDPAKPTPRGNEQFDVWADLVPDGRESALLGSSCRLRSSRFPCRCQFPIDISVAIFARWHGPGRAVWRRRHGCRLRLAWPLWPRSALPVPRKTDRGRRRPGYGRRANPWPTARWSG